MIATEAQEQGAVVTWARYGERAHPELRLLFAVPNGDLRNKIVAAKLKWQGVRPGVPDLILPIPRPPYCGLAIEMKRRRGGVLSAEQRAYLEALRAYGWRAVVCAGADEAIGELRRYLATTNTEERNEHDDLSGEAASPALES